MNRRKAWIAVVGVALLVGMGVVVVARDADRPFGIGEVDFDNFTYDLHAAGRPSVTVHNGFYESEPRTLRNDIWKVRVDHVVYGDIGEPVVAVVLFVGDYWGMSEENYVFVYVQRGGRPTLLDVLPGGSNALGGVYDVEISAGRLRVDRSESDNDAHCCPSFVTERDYVVSRGQFLEIGGPVWRAALQLGSDDGPSVEVAPRTPRGVVARPITGYWIACFAAMCPGEYDLTMARRGRVHVDVRTDGCHPFSVVVAGRRASRGQPLDLVAGPGVVRLFTTATPGAMWTIDS